MDTHLQGQRFLRRRWRRKGGLGSPAHCGLGVWVHLRLDPLLLLLTLCPGGDRCRAPRLISHSIPHAQTPEKLYPGPCFVTRKCLSRFPSQPVLTQRPPSLHPQDEQPQSPAPEQRLQSPQSAVPCTGTSRCQGALPGFPVPLHTYPFGIWVRLLLWIQRRLGRCGASAHLWCSLRTRLTFLCYMHRKGMCTPGSRAGGDETGTCVSSPAWGRHLPSWTRNGCG